MQVYFDHRLLPLFLHFVSPTGPRETCLTYPSRVQHACWMNTWHISYTTGACINWRTIWQCLLQQWFSTADDFAPQGTLVSARREVCLSRLEEGMLLAFSGQRPGGLLSILQRTGQPLQQRIPPAHGVYGAKAEMTHLFYDPEILLLGIYAPGKLCICLSKTCSRILVAALFIKAWKQSKSPLIG